MLVVNGETLSMLRTARGFSQAGLAEAVGMAQSRLSRVEQGTELLRVSDAGWLAAELEVLPEVLAEKSGEFSSARVFHRKRASLPVKSDRQIRAEAAVRRFQLRRAIGEALPGLQLEFRPLPADGTYSPEDRAMELRRGLGLGSEPIESMTEVLERAGVMVVPVELDTVKLDAIGGWPEDGAPIVMVSTHAPGERQRFTLAHELGHAIMHDGTGDDQEAEADQFASAFLMPVSMARSELVNPTLSSLTALKSRWGVSIAALARRARDLGLMTEREYRSFNIQLSSTGMHRREPLPIPPERPTLITRTIDQLIARGDTLGEIAARAGMSADSFTRTYVEAR
ncbi:XRE family transcriptional regulator [Leifsonia sp. LS1]|uniref:XRE family transcriptional regulator n=1 Tax=Leifsonia sp. LS1 TaxID=2828483 RepID=UPI001CFCF6BA|nr:XRE family transcriptional regulator [Leifsonia sp. LS1]